MLNHIQITNWKGHDKFELSLYEGINFLTGPNGIGKTSVLDAICYAFLGTIKFMSSYHGIKDSDLVRDSNKECVICITFNDPKGVPHEVTRRIGTSRRAQLKADGKIIATSWQEVTDKVVHIYNASDIFLGRYVFLTEGETYAYINQPPGEGLAKHIENVLGIDSMENLGNIFQFLHKEYTQTEKNTRDQIKIITIATEEDKKAIGQIKEQIRLLTDERNNGAKETAKLDKEIYGLSIEIKSMNESINTILALLKEWQDQTSSALDEQNPLSVIKRANQQIEMEYEQQSKSKTQLSTEIGERGAIIRAQKSVTNMLASVPNVVGAKYCPICKRPLTEHMIEQINGECTRIIRKAENDLVELNKRASTNEAELKENRRRLNVLSSFESKLISVLKNEPKTISVPVIDKKIADLKDKFKILTGKTNDFRAITEKLDKQIIELKTKEKQIDEKVDPKRLITLNNSLFNYTKIEFLSEVFLTAIQDSLAKQRSIVLAPLMEELSTMWTNFMGTPVKIAMNSGCELEINYDRSNTLFKFPQLSGGEKTALLILTHMLLCKYLSDSDFMLIDEPLEHLDSRNRWALVNFLVQYCKKGMPKQLVVTTIEEQYLREYMNDAAVHVTNLG